MTYKEPNKEDAPYRPVKPGGKPWPGYPKPMPPGKDWPVKKAKSPYSGKGPNNA